MSTPEAPSRKYGNAVFEDLPEKYKNNGSSKVSKNKQTNKKHSHRHLYWIIFSMKRIELNQNKIQFERFSFWFQKLSYSWYEYAFQHNNLKCYKMPAKGGNIWLRWVFEPYVKTPPLRLFSFFSKPTLAMVKAAYYQILLNILKTKQHYIFITLWKTQVMT